MVGHLTLFGMNKLLEILAKIKWTKIIDWLFSSDEEEEDE